MSKLSSKGDTKPNRGGVNHNENHRRPRRNSSPSKTTTTTRKRKQVDTPITTTTATRPNYLSPTISSAKKARKGPLFAAAADKRQTKVDDDDMAATLSEFPHHHQGKKEDRSTEQARASSPASTSSSSSGLDLLATMATTSSLQELPPKPEPQRTTTSSSSTYCFQVTSQQPLLSVVQGSADGTLQITSLSSTVTIQQGLWLVGLPDHDSKDYSADDSGTEQACRRWSLGHAEASHSVQDANDIDIQELELSTLQSTNATSSTSTTFVALVAHAPLEKEQVLIPPSVLSKGNTIKEITTWSNGCLWNFTSLQQQHNHNNRLKLILVLDHRRQSEQPLISMDVILMHNDGSNLNPQASMLHGSSDMTMIPSQQQQLSTTMQRPSTPALGALATRTTAFHSNEKDIFDLEMNEPEQRLLQRDLFGTQGRSKKAPDIPTSQKEPSSSGTKPKTTASNIQEEPSSFSKAIPRQAVVKTSTTGNSPITALTRSNHHKRRHSVGIDNSSSSLSNKSKPSNKTSSPSVSLQRYWEGGFATSSSFAAVPPATHSKKLSTTRSSKKNKIVASTTKSNTKGTASLSNNKQPQPATSSKRKPPSVAPPSAVKKNKSKAETTVPAASSTCSVEDDDSFDQEAAARAVRLYHQQQGQAKGTSKSKMSAVKSESSVSNKPSSKKAATTKQKLSVAASTKSKRNAKHTLRNGASHVALQKHLTAWDSSSDDESSEGQPSLIVSKKKAPSAFQKAPTSSSTLRKVKQGSSSTTTTPKLLLHLHHGNRALSFGKTRLSSTTAKNTPALNGNTTNVHRRPQHSSSNSSPDVHTQARTSSIHDAWSDDDDDDDDEDPLPTKLRFSLGGLEQQPQKEKVAADASFQTSTDVGLENKCTSDEDHHPSDEDQDFEDAQCELNVPEWDTSGTLTSSFRWGSWICWMMMMLLASSIVALLTIGMLGSGSSFRFQPYFAFDLGKITNALVVAGQQFASKLKELCSFLADLSKSSVPSLASIKQESVFWLRLTQTFAAFQYNQIAGFVDDRSSWPLLPFADTMMGTMITWIQLAGGFVEPSELELDSSFQIKLADFLLHLQAESNIHNI